MRRGITGLILPVAISVLLTALLTGARGAPLASIVRNGSFERPLVPIGGNVVYVAGETFGNWRVVSGSIDHIGEGYWQAARGVQSVDLNGFERGSIRQVLVAESGQTYTLRLSLAGNPDCGGSVKDIRIKWESTVVADLSFDTTGHSRGDMGWTSYAFDVVASSSSPRLSFISLTEGPCGPALDAISVTA